MYLRLTDGTFHKLTNDNTIGTVYAPKEVIMQALVLLAGESEWSFMNHVQHYCDVDCPIPRQFDGITFIYDGSSVPRIAQEEIAVAMNTRPTEDEFTAWISIKGYDPRDSKPISQSDLKDFLKGLDQAGIWTELLGEEE